MLEIVPGRYLSLTPYGAYYVVSDGSSNAMRRILLAILMEGQSPELSQEAACRWAGTDDAEAALDALSRLQSLAMLQATDTPLMAPDAPLEQELPPLLAALSATGQALLADAQGFYLASAGFRHEVTEELAALSADIATLHDRHAGLLAHNLRLSGSSWGLLDPAGASQLGIWPLYVGSHRFALALAGQPRLAQGAFARLVWALARRYGSVD